ncbi:hypothetical protein EMIT0111MI5_10130 [Burkholderia sp. IT-111MI5]
MPAARRAGSRAPTPRRPRARRPASAARPSRTRRRWCEIVRVSSLVLAKWVAGQLRAQVAPRAGEQAFQRINGDAHQVGCFHIRHFLIVLEHERFPLPRRQRGKRLPHARIARAQFRMRGRLRLRIRHVGQRIDGLLAPAAQPVVAQVQHDAMQPRVETRLAFAPARRLIPDSQERLLCDVLGFAPIAEHARRQCEQPRQLARDEHAHRRRIARADARDEFRVRIAVAAIVQRRPLRRAARLRRAVPAGVPAARLKLIVVLSLHASGHRRAAPRRRFGNAVRIARGVAHGVGHVRFIDIRFARHIDPVGNSRVARLRNRRPACSIYDDRRGPVIHRTRRHHDAASQHDGRGRQYHDGSKRHGFDS